MPAPRKNRNAELHGLYRLDRVRRGVGPPLDGRTRLAKVTNQRMDQIAVDLGYSGLGDAPAILQDLIRGAVFCALQCRIIESIPPEERTERMQDDFRDWYKMTLKVAQIVGIVRVPRDLHDLALELAEDGQ